jgi:hypothetical protein
MELGKKWKRLGAVAVCGLALAASREFYGRSIAPLRQEETETLREIADLRERVESARKTIAEIREQEKDADRIRNELERIENDLPAGSAMVSVPALVSEHFARFGISVPLVRLNRTQDEPSIPGYGRGFWSVALPIDEAGRNIPILLVSVADLDQRNSFVRVLDFSIRPDPETPGGRIGTLNLTAVIRK